MERISNSWTQNDIIWLKQIAFVCNVFHHNLHPIVGFVSHHKQLCVCVYVSRPSLPLSLCVTVSARDDNVALRSLILSNCNSASVKLHMKHPQSKNFLMKFPRTKLLSGQIKTFLHEMGSYPVFAQIFDSYGFCYEGLQFTISRYMFFSISLFIWICRCFVSFHPFDCDSYCNVNAMHRSMWLFDTCHFGVIGIIFFPGGHANAIQLGHGRVHFGIVMGDLPFIQATFHKQFSSMVQLIEVTMLLAYKYQPCK